MYYPSSENKGADQLRGYREADLRLCFRIGNNPVFSRCGSYKMYEAHHSQSYHMSCVMRKPTFCLCENITAKPISAFAFAIQVVQFLSKSKLSVTAQTVWCWTCSKTTLFVFSCCGSYVCVSDEALHKLYCTTTSEWLKA